MIRLHVADLSIDAAAPDAPPSRSITGLAVPWNVTTTDSLGTRVLFEQGSLPEDGRAPKLVESHDLSQVRGLVTERVSTDQGMMFTARIASTRAGDDAMELLKMGAIDAVSVGVEPVDYTFDKDGVMRVQSAIWHELSLVAIPAYESARITSVAASAPEEEPEADEPEPQYPEPEEDSIMTDTPELVEATTPTTPIHFAAPRAFTMPSASEYISKFMAGGSEFAEFNARIRAAAPDVVTTDTPGILPEPIVGTVYDSLMANYRPLVNAFGTKAMPGSGKTFRRPKVTTHTTIGASNGENVALDAGTFVVSDNSIQKTVLGGYVKLSEEDQEWTEPAVLSLIVSDMAKIYAKQTDITACTNLQAGITQSGSVLTKTDPASWIGFVYDAAATILANANGNLPTHLLVGSSDFAALGKLVDTTDRPLFPAIGPMNAAGTASPASSVVNAFGLSVVVDPNWTADPVVCHPDGFEIYEQQKGAISVEAADGSLSRYIKFRGYFATFMIDATKFVVAS